MKRNHSHFLIFVRVSKQDILMAWRKINEQSYNLYWNNTSNLWSTAANLCYAIPFVANYKIPLFVLSRVLVCETVEIWNCQIETEGLLTRLDLISINRISENSPQIIANCHCTKKTTIHQRTIMLFTSKRLWPGNRTLVEVDSMAFSWWIVAFFCTVYRFIKVLCNADRDLLFWSVHTHVTYRSLILPQQCLFRNKILIIHSASACSSMFNVCADVCDAWNEMFSSNANHFRAFSLSLYVSVSAPVSLCLSLSLSLSLSLKSLYQAYNLYYSTLRI